MNKVWFVQRSHGSYEDYIDWTDSVWTTFKEAKERALELVHYDPQKELDKLPVLTVDCYGNNLTVAEVMFSGTGFEGEKWAEGAITMGAYDKESNEWVCPEELKETHIQLHEHPHYLVEKEFLEKHKITVEDADKYINWLHDSEYDEGKPCIYEMEISKPDAKSLVYIYNELSDDYCADREMQ